MDVRFAMGKFGQAYSILAENPARIHERMQSAYSNALSRIPRTDIPPEFLDQYDEITRTLSRLDLGDESPSEVELQILAVQIHDMYALLESSLTPVD